MLHSNARMRSSWPKPAPARESLLPGLALLPLLLLATPLAATVITVDRFDSSTAEDGQCSLREAIAAANGDTATGGCPPGSGADTIVLGGDVTLTLEDSFATGTPKIFTRITVRGNGHTIARDSAAADFRIFWVAPEGDLELRDTTISGGTTPISSDGGGIYNQGILSLTNSNLFSNTGDNLGGGIYSGPGSRLLVVGSALVLNRAIVFGGAIASYGVATIIDSAFVLNESAFGGGVLLNFNGEMTVTGSVVNANANGGLEAQGGTVDVINSTVSGHPGAGVYNAGGDVTLTHVTVSGNLDGVVNFLAGGTLVVAGSIIADSSGNNCVEVGPITDGGHNLVDDASCPGFGSLDVSKFDTGLLDNGGPTMTHRLLAGSNAIGTGGSCGLLTDQRGALREGACDIGAYEYFADDRYETSGAGGTDDACPGHHIQFGRAERHLHTVDEDWIWFQPNAGSTYEIETSALIGGSDTVLELWRGCSTSLGMDNDGGVGLASKITHLATTDDVAPGLGVVVTDVNGYDNGVGYDVAVRCVSGGCAACAAAGGPQFVLRDERVVGYRDIEACSRITLLDTVIEAGGTAILRSGDSVELGNGFAVAPSGLVVIAIDPHLQ